MLKKIISSKATVRSSNIFQKLKKKWRFWRAFRFFFLRIKKKNFFPKINWLFHQRKMVWHQLVATYGKKIKNLVYTKHKSKKIFNIQFGQVLCKLELRLNVLVLRVGFVNTLRLADFSVSSGSVMVNFKIKHKRYLVRINDLISFSILFLKVQDLKRLKKKIWRSSKWNKWKKQSKNKKFRKVYFTLKKNFIFNFMELNYYYFFGILLRSPNLGEVSYRNKKRFLTSRLLQKIYFLY